MDKKDAAGYLKAAAEGLREGSTLFMADPELSRAMLIAAGLANVGSVLLAMGKDPVEHITRLLDLDEEFATARAQVDAEAKDLPGG